jgi:histidine triad (HIT) family protein
MDDTCIFCRIAAGQARAEIVHEDELAVAFKDATPQAPVHILVVPRKHLASLADAGVKDTALLGHLLQVGLEVARAAGIGQGFRTVINTGPIVGQSVFHLHVHIMGGRRMGWPPG